MHHMAAIELGGDVYRQIAVAQRLVGNVRVGRSRRKISTECEKHFTAACSHQLDGFNRVNSVGARRLKAENFL